MKNYKFYVKNSNGTETLLRERVLKNDEEADKVLEDIDVGLGHDYRWEAGTEINQEDFEDAVESGEVETEEDEDSDVEEFFETEDEVEEVDADWVDEADEDEFPRGWHRRNEFVSKDGTVFHQGEEQPDLYRTVEPSDY